MFDKDKIKYLVKRSRQLDAGVVRRSGPSRSCPQHTCRDVQPRAVAECWCSAKTESLEPMRVGSRQQRFARSAARNSLVPDG